MPREAFSYREIFDAYPIAATLVDADTVIVDVNRAFLELAASLGLSIRREERIGRPLGDFAARAGERERIEGVARRALDTGQTQHLRRRWQRPEAHLAYLDVQVRPVVTREGRITGAVILRQHLSEAERLHRRRQVTAQVRDEVWKIERSGDMRLVLKSVQDGLRELDVPFNGCSVNLVEDKPAGPEVRAHAMSRDGTWQNLQVATPAAEALVAIWRSQEPVYRRDLEREDPFHEVGSLARYYGEPIRSVVDIPLPQGSLAVNSTEAHAFTAEDIEVLGEMGTVISEGLARMAGLQAMEARNRDLQREVTERRLAEEALALESQRVQASEERYRQLVENLPIGIAHTTSDGRTLYVNPRAREILGYGDEPLESLRAPDLYVHPEDRQDLLTSLADRGEHSYEYLLQRRDGEPIWVRGATAAVPDAEGELVVFQGYLEDITQQRRRESVARAIRLMRDAVWRMRRSSDIQQVLSATEESLALLDVDYQGLGVNVVDASVEPPLVTYYETTRDHDRGRWDMQTQTTEDRVITDTWRQGVPCYRPDLGADDVHGEQRGLIQDYGPGIRSVIDVPFSHGTLAVNSTRPHAFPGDVVDFLQQLAMVLSEGFQRLHDLEELELRARDLEDQIANRERLEAQLLQAQKMEAIGQLTAGIAHNFNNLLQGVIGNLSLAAEEVEGPARQFLADAETSAVRGADLVRQLLVFSRQSARPQYEPVDVARLIGDTLAICRRTFDHSIRLEAELVTDLPPVLGHRGQLEQGLLNLLINARDAVTEAGTPGPEIRINARLTEVAEGAPAEPDLPAGEYLRLTVVDNGPGMDEDTRLQIFDPFFTTKDVGAGTGLGLSTVYGIARQHGGWVECDARPEAGAAFSVFLPVDETAPLEVETPAEEAVGGSESLLVVDDEEVVRHTTARMLELFGYRVREAGDGESALRLVAEEEIDLVLLDLSMPGMSGSEVNARLREIAPQVKVVLFTGYASDSQDTSAADGIVQKPFSAAAMAREIRRVLG